MMAIRIQHFLLNWCISVILFLWLAGVFGLEWEFYGERANDRSGQSWLPAILSLCLGVISDKKSPAVGYKGLWCSVTHSLSKSTFSVGCQQGVWDHSSRTMQDSVCQAEVGNPSIWLCRSKLCSRMCGSDIKGVWVLTGCGWALSSAASVTYYISGAAAYAGVQVVLLLPKLLIANQVALKCDRMIRFHKKLFYTYFLLSSLWQVLESLQTVSGLQPGTLFSNPFSTLFLSVMFCLHGNSLT